MTAGEDPMAQLDAMHDLAAGQTVADRVKVLTALEEHLGAGPVGCLGMSMACRGSRRTARRGSSPGTSAMFT
jgi:hypothetical protein